MKKLPAYRSMLTNIRNWKHLSENYIPEPEIFDDIELDQLRTFKNVLGEDLLYARITEPSPILIFTADTSLKILEDCDLWACDGTRDVSFVFVYF